MSAPEKCAWCPDRDATSFVNIDRRKGRYHSVPVCEEHRIARERDIQRLADEAEAKKKARRR